MSAPRVHKNNHGPGSLKCPNCRIEAYDIVRNERWTTSPETIEMIMDDQSVFLLEESARSYSEARIRPLTHVSVDRAYQVESVGSNSLLSTLIAIRCSPIYE